MKTFIALAFLLLALPLQAVTAFYYTPGGSKWTYMTIGESRIIKPSETLEFFAPEPLFDTPKNKSFFLRILERNFGELVGGTLFFVNPTAPEPLAPGAYIGNNFAIEGHNGLGFAWGQDGRMVGSTSWVTILEIEYGPDGVLPTKLAMDFIHFENTYDRLDVNFEDYRYSFGSFRYNSSIPLTAPVPEPTSAVFVGTAMFFFLRRRR